MMLEVNDLVSGYGRIQVLNGISLKVTTEKKVGIFGPNGHGKTTLLRTISGLVKTSSGSVIYRGVKLDGLSPKEIVDLGVVHSPQGNLLFPQMSVMDCLTLGAFTPKAWIQRTESLSMVFDLFPKLKKRSLQNTKSLSGGERQMLSIACALMAVPEVLMLDEPSFGLAPKLIEELSQGIKKIAASGGAMVLVDQNLEMLTECCDTLYLLEQGLLTLESEELGKFDKQRMLDRYFGKDK